MDQETLKKLVGDLVTEFLPDTDTHTFRFSFLTGGLKKLHIVGYHKVKGIWQTSMPGDMFRKQYTELEDFLPSIWKWAGKK